MSKAFVETSSHLLEGIDEMIREGYYANRAEAVNEALLDEVQRLRKRLEKHEASHGKQQVSGDTEEDEVDGGAKTDASGEEGSSG